MELNVFFALAGAAALGTLGLHVFVGGRLFAAPLLASENLHRVVRLTLYYCWHSVTVVVAGMSGGFFFVAVASEHTSHTSLGAALTGLAAALALLSVVIVSVHRVAPLRMPQWLLFGVTATLGAAGVFG